MSKRIIKKRAETRATTPVMQDLFDLLDADPRPDTEVAEHAGVSRVSLSLYRMRGVLPRVDILEALAGALGCRVILVPADEDKDVLE